jgi:tight adherence protein B
LSAAALLAFVAGAAAGAALLELGGLALSRASARAPRWAQAGAGLVEVLVRAGREGRDPGAAERRRLLLAVSAAAFAGGAITVGPLAGLAMSAAGPWAVARLLRARRERYRTAVDAGVAQAAVAIADAIGGGRSLRAALGEAAGGLGGAAGHELRRTRAELDAGAATDHALEAMRTRVRSPRMDTLVAACVLQNRAGGDLAGLLRESARAMEDQGRLEDEVRSATAQARFTAMLVVLMPVGGGLLAELASPGWFAGLWGSLVTAWLVGIALVLQVIAAVLTRRLGRVRW